MTDDRIAMARDGQPYRINLKGLARMLDMPPATLSTALQRGHLPSLEPRKTGNAGHDFVLPEALVAFFWKELRQTAGGNTDAGRRAVRIAERANSVFLEYRAGTRRTPCFYVIRFGADGEAHDFAESDGHLGELLSQPRTLTGPTLILPLMNMTRRFFENFERHAVLVDTTARASRRKEKAVA